MLRIGLTGGIGCGKTTVAGMFEVLGVPVYFADEAAKRLMNEEPIRAEIIRHFGKESYGNEGLNRFYLAAAVFSDPSKTDLINSIVHPATLADAERWMDGQTVPYAVKEAALIFEAGAEKHLDFVIGVSAPFELRLKRAMQRDNISEEAVRARMQKQMPEAEKINRCDFVLVNDETRLLTPQVIKLHTLLIAKATQASD